MAQAQDSWLFPYRPLDVTAFLRSIGSPRAIDLPLFAGWVHAAAEAGDISPKFLLMLAEKEQSFLTRARGGEGWQRALDFTLGFGALEGGTDLKQYKGVQKQVQSAAKGLRKYLTPGHGLDVGPLVGKKFTDPHGESYTPANLAEAALLLYTPWVYALRDAVAIYTRYWPEEAETMASGFASLHPRQVDTLEELGITSGQVTQGVGNAPASAGYHSPEGENPADHKYSSCVDLSYSLADRPLFDRLVAAAWCPFVRDTGSFATNKHIHCITVGLRDSADRVRILPGPRMQIIDFCAGRDGLVQHGNLPAKWKPSATQRDFMRAAYTAWAPGVATKVYAPEGNQIVCYAFLEGDTIRCEARAFLLYWGALVTWHTDHLEASLGGKVLDLAKCNFRIEGAFTRGDLRPLAEALGLHVKFNWAEDGLSAEVRLSY